MIYDLAILGGGPAGSAAGVYASRKRLPTIYITKDWHGQSTVSEGIENWIGTIKIPGLELSKSLENHVKAYAGDMVKFAEGETVILIKKVNDLFKIKTDKAEYEAKTVLITTGSHRRKLEALGADKFEHKGITYCASCDGPMFSGQDVMVIGGGNAAFESTAQLLAYCKSVTIINRSENFRADPETVEKVLSHPNVKVLKNSVIREVRGEKFVSSVLLEDTVSKETEEIMTGGIFVEIGSLPNTDFAKELVELDNYGHIKVDARNQRTSVTGIWSAGDCTDGLYHQNNIAVGDGVKALEDIYLFLKAR